MTLSLPNRAIAAGLTLAVALWLGGAAFLAPAAQAVTIEELQATIADLQAQLAALTGGSSSTGCYAFTRDLTLGATGADVTALQNYLTPTYFTFAGGATGYFGTITQASVAAWQVANGVAPAAGYFGPISRAKYNAVCVGTSGDDGEAGGGLSGGAGAADYTLMSTISGEEVGEAAEDVEEYAKEVAVFLDGEELGRVDADEFNDDNAFQATVSLDGGGVIEEDEMGEATVAVSGANTIDSGNVTETWTADIVQVRYTDANGSTVSEDPGTGTRTFSFETFATASDLELHITLADNDDVNKGHLVDVHATENTRATILDFDIENQGDTDLVYKAV